MYHYGDNKMDFLDAVLIAKTRGLEEEVRTHNLAPDLVLATKTLINGMDAEMKKASECGYVKGFASAIIRSPLSFPIKSG